MTAKPAAAPPNPDALSEDRLREAIESMYFAYRAFTRPPDRILAQRGLGRVHHRILYFVGRNPGVTVNGLLAILEVSKQALHAPLRELAGLGLVETRPAAHDGRVRELRLSAEGTHLEAGLSGTQLELLRDALRAAPAAQRRGWFAVMRALASPPPDPA